MDRCGEAGGGKDPTCVRKLAGVGGWGGCESGGTSGKEAELRAPGRMTFI